MRNWCSKCNGAGFTGLIWWAKKCNHCNGIGSEPPPKDQSSVRLPPPPPRSYGSRYISARDMVDRKIRELEKLLDES